MLAAVEQELRNLPFVVIGVHSPKFPNERDGAMVRRAVKRYDIDHPVVVDSGHRIWEAFSVHAWPTLILVGGSGRIAAATSGEPDAARIVSAVRRLAKLERLEQREPLSHVTREKEENQFRFPGKVEPSAGKLYVADSGHHQVVELEAASMQELRRFGDGSPRFAEASFRHPQGLAADGHQGLYVADSGNHAIRRIDLGSGTIRTVAGTGRLGRVTVTDPIGKGADLRSPWDLAFDPVRNRLYIAMAGSHQIFVHDPVADSLAILSGTGWERCLDGPLRKAAFAQPSGLTLVGDQLYVADSEVSSIRRIDLDRAEVALAAGSGDLFGFGHRDGSGALFQHPMGIAADAGSVYVADTFNHAIRVLDRESGLVSTLPLPTALSEPEGICLLGQRLCIADTNNHRLVTVPLP